MLGKEELMQQYLEKHRLYINTPHKEAIRAAEMLMSEGQLEGAEKILATLDSKDQLLEKLYAKLKGKSVAATLRDILEGKCKNFYQGLKGMFSLCTHLCIELEKGNMEYKPLLDDTLANIHKQLTKDIPEPTPEKAPDENRS